MAIDTLTRSRLWQQAFNTRDDGNDKHRDRYSSALIRFRERVGSLLTFIPSDMKHYTVHDLSHLDALWEIADLISGEHFSLNPAEAFVFGGAVLLHDAGMCIAAYPRGIDEIKEKPEWSDSYSWAESLLESDPDNLLSTAEIQALAITDILRKHHAAKAGELATQAWLNPHKNEDEYLLEDSELRSHFGPTIGAIAHSHHWSIRKLLIELQPTIGAFDEAPSEWSVDCTKIALLLRCADAAHLDHRRAPRLLFALTRPTGVSKTHWTFQAKLAKPLEKDGKLLYTSRSAFTLNDIDAWHLCWDMIKMVDRELSDSCDVLIDKRSTPFHISGVLGAKSADTLAKHVLVEGWRPVPTELQVSDVPHLARTLGGRDLYSTPFAPLRELLQNAADSIDARAALDEDFEAPEARITVRIFKEESFIILSVEDDGLGMSEKTLTGALLDFGTSFWKSDAARNEFPGLQAAFEPRGRYGIGFFSVFMWADNVKVSSRKFSEGIADARILEFTAGLGSRPILRPAKQGESSTKFCTKVTLYIPEANWKNLFNSRIDDDIYLRTRKNLRRPFGLDEENTISQLTAMLKIPVYFDDATSAKLVNMPDWASASSEQFISFLEKLNGREYTERLRRFAKSESRVTKDGRLIGRAFLSPSFDQFSVGAAIYELGIFVGYDRSTSNIHGLLEGHALNAARDRVGRFDVFSDMEWVEKQIDYMTRFSEHLGDAIACQEALLKNGIIARELAAFLLNRRECSLAQLLTAVGKREKIRFSLDREMGKEAFEVGVVDRVDPFIGKEVDEDRIYFLVGMPDKVLSNEVEQFIAEGQGPLAHILREIQKSLGNKIVIKSTLVDKDNFTRRQILSVEMCRASGS